MVEQPALHFDHVAHGDSREFFAIGLAGCRVDAAGAGRPAASAQQVGADDEEAAGIHRFARANHDVPPAWVVLLIVLGHMGVAAEGMADQDGIGLGGIEVAVGFVHNG